jgi:hypothetical protein
VDPELRTIEVFETVNGRPALAATGRDNEALVLPPFEESIALGGLWIPSRSRPVMEGGSGSEGAPGGQ